MQYYGWKNGSEGGRFMLECVNNTLVYKYVSGSAPTDDIVLYLILSNIDFAKKAMSLKRSCAWRRIIREGMSGCTDWYIQYFVNADASIRRNHVWHSSMLNKANENLEVYIKDIFDIFADTECISRVKACWTKGMVDPIEITKKIIEQDDLILYRDEQYENLVSDFKESTKGTEFYYDFPLGEDESDETPYEEDYSNYQPVDDGVDEDKLYS